MNKEIGDRGKNVNDTYASRSMNTPPDEEHFKQFDEYNEWKFFFLLLFLSIGMLGLTIYLFATGHWIWGILGVIVTSFLAVMPFASRYAIQEMAYEHGLIIPAIIINTNPIELLVMTSMDTYSGQIPILGVMKMKVKNLPNHTIALNEKVPCVSLFKGKKKGYHKKFIPRPISWGFKDASIISKTVKVISEEQPDNGLFSTDWEILYKLKDKIKKDRSYKTIFFFDINLNEVKL
jgi:hypothetical protein